MIKVTVLYPSSEGGRFDMDYYLSTHLPLCQELLGEACKGTEAELGLNGGAPGVPAPFVAQGHLYFDSEASFQEAFAANAGPIMSDVANYTDLAPVMVVSELKGTRAEL